MALIAGAARREQSLLAVVALGTVLAPLNSTMIAVALPNLGAEFSVGVQSTGWLIISYLIAMAVVQPIAGRLGDMLNRRQLFLSALIGFLITSLAATAAPSFPALVALRIAQGICGALAIPNGTAMVREFVPSGRLGTAFGLVGAAAGLAAGLGPPLGGLLVGTWGWRAIFFANVPVVALALALGWFTLPESRRRRTEAGFDLIGAFLLFLWLSGLALLPSSLRGSGSGLPLPLLAGVTVLSLLAFIRYELRLAQPVVQLKLFQERAFAAAAVGIATGNLAMYATLLTVPEFLTQVHHRSAAEAGLILAALSVPMAALAPFAGRLADRWGRRPVAVLGSGLALIALAPLLLLNAGWPAWLLAVPLALAGSGLALQTPAIQAAAIEAAPVHQAGVASGVYSTSRYLGSIVGSAALATLLGTSAEPSGSGLFAVFAMVVTAALMATLAAAALPGRPAIIAEAAPRA